MSDSTLSPLTDCLNIAQAAMLLGVTSKTLRNWDRAGKLKAMRHPVNGYRLYPAAELRQLVDQAMKSRRGRPRTAKAELI